MATKKRTLMKLQDMDKEQKKKLFVTFFCYLLVGFSLLTYFSLSLYNEKIHADDDWEYDLHDPPEQAALADELSVNAQRISVGTYIENLRELNIKSSYFRVEFMVWFNWTGDEDLNPAGNFRVYKGLINKNVLMEESHEDGRHYQLVSVDASISKNFDTKRFPLESHQLRIYVESTDPIQEVRFIPDTENSGINRSISLSGYEFTRNDVGAVSYLYDSTHGNPDVKEREMTSEIVTAFEINRASMGLYFKCFIALVGTITWVLIALVICTYHHVDPLGMLPGALFGTVGNIMIGASLLPDALELGLLEYVNLWGILMILGVTIAIININQSRKKNQQNQDYANIFGTVLFFTMLFFALAGNIIMPLVAYAW